MAPIVRWRALYRNILFLKFSEAKVQAVACVMIGKSIEIPAQQGPRH